MDDTPDIASLAALVGDPTRAAMLVALMDGRAHTATELSLEGGVAPSTASSHLARMTSGGLLSIARQGRHRYYRLRSSEVAAALEGLMGLTSPPERRRVVPGPADPDLRRARVCYDHLAGEAGVRLLDGLRRRRLLTGDDGEMALTRAGRAWCSHLGLDPASPGRSRRPLCLPCLDWSERRTHLAGWLGAALLTRLFERRWARRALDSRALILTARGERFLERLDLDG